MKFSDYFPKFIIQTFDDAGLGRNELIKLGSIQDYPLDYLKKLNKAGAGIFFTPNQFPPNARGVDKCLGINAWYADLDWKDWQGDTESKHKAQLDMLHKALKCPTFIVKTKNGLHAYWLAKNATLGNFKRLAKGLVVAFKGDPACAEVSRVLRVPGFYHMKDQSQPFKIELIESNPELVYTEEEMLEAFPYKETPKKLLASYEGFWSHITSQNQKDMLYRLSGTSIVNGETISFATRGGSGGEYILVNGKSSNAWIDPDGHIGSGNRGGPTWVQWLTYYGRTKSEIYAWVRDNMPDIMPNPLSDVELKSVDLEFELKEFRDILNMKQLENTWGKDEFDCILPNIQRYSFITLFGASGSGKTTFAVSVARKNAESFGRKSLFFQLDMSVPQMRANYAVRREGVNKEERRTGFYDTNILEQYLPELDNTLEIYDSKYKSLDSIVKVIREKKDAPMVVIDCLDMIDTENKKDLDAQKQVTSTLSSLSHELKIPILLIHHANKNFDKKSEDGSRGLEGLRGSMKIVDNSDIVCEIFRKDDKITVKTYKDRDNLIVDSLNMKFVNGEFYIYY